MGRIMKNDAIDETGVQTLQRVGHCLYRSDKTRVYYAILRRGGKQIKRSLRTSDQVLAKRRLADLEEKAQRLNQTGAAKVLFTDLGNRWHEVLGASLKPSSHLRQRVVLNSLNPYFGTMMVRGITRTHVEKWASERSKTCAARTFNQERATLARLFAFAMRDGLVLDNPATVVKRLKPTMSKAVIPTKDQFKALIEAIRALKVTARDAANLCELLAYSGCRLAEATSMRWGDVTFEVKQFTVTGGDLGTKNHEARTVPLFPALERFLRQLRESLPQPPQAGDRICPIDNAKKALISACKAAGLPHFTHHHLRHFFCSNAIEAGVDFKAIAGWLGHKDGGLLVAKTYGHLRDEHSTAMAQRMTFDAIGVKA
jgi:integrase